MVEIKKAPKSGIVIASFLNKVIFDYYKIKDDKIFLIKKNKYLGLNNLRDLHLFNNKYEYRYFYRFNHPCSIVISESDENKYDKNNIFHENVIVRESFFHHKKLHIVSYFEYTENDTLSLVNYRLVGLVNE